MDDFDTFKASREKIDPTSRKFSERQWQKAYAAYCNSRKRVTGKTSTQSGESSRRQKKSGREGTKHVSSYRNPVAGLRNELRQNSAYSDLRLLLDLLAWIAIGVVVLAGVLKLAYYTDLSLSLAALLDTAVKVIGIVLLRLLAHVIIDIPDIALYNRISEEANAEKEQVNRQE